MALTDQTAATPQNRTRFLLILLGVVAVGALIYTTWPAAEPKNPPSNQGRDARKPQPTTGASGSLEVRLGELKQPPAGSAETTRNPFKFYVNPPPPPPPTPPRPTVTTPPPPTPQSTNPSAPNYVP